LPALAIDNVTQAETHSGATNFVFTVTLTGSTAQTVTVNYATADGTATAGSDYTATPGTLTFAPGITTQTITVPVVGDAVNEVNETFAVNLSGAVNGTISTATGNGTIVNDDGAPTLLINNVSQAEGNGGTTNFVFTVTLAGSTAQTVTVNYATADGTATAPGDYASTSGPLTFAPGTLTQTITVPVAGDAVNEAAEAFTVALSVATNATITTASGTGTIQNDDAAPALAIDNVTQAETHSGTASFVFTVTLTGSTAQTVTVNYATANGTATAPGDYATTTGTLTFTPGTLTQTITVPVVGDAVNEANETFAVNLSGAVNGTISTATGNGTIVNDDGAPTLLINNVSQAEGNGGTTNFVFTVTLAGSTAQTVTVNYATADGTATAPGDYASTSGPLTFAPGTLTQTITVPVAGDAVNEAAEAFTVALSVATNATITTASGTGTIQNDDAAPALAIDNVTQAETHSGTASFVFTVTLTGSTAQTVTVNYATANGTATAPGDYATTTGTLTFTPGTLTQTITVPVVGDAVNEANETFAVNLSGAVNGTISTATGNGTIVNDDGAPTLLINNVSQAEGNGGTTNFVFTVTLTGSTAQTVTVNYVTANGTATAPGDYASTSGTLTFAPGTLTQTITVPVVGDAVNEADEAFTVALSGATNATITTANGTGTIQNDDAAPALAIDNVTQASGPEGGGTSVTITGSGFNAGATVTFGGTAATNVVVSANSITATTPAHSPGAVDVTVRNSDGQRATSTGAFTYIAAPLVTSISPSSGRPSGGTNVTISGTGFLTGATVTFGGTAATNVTVVSSTSITATTQAHAAGAADVVVRNPDGQSATLTGSFTYVVAPTGDANGDGAVTAIDIFYLINNLFAGGPGPISSGDVNGDGAVTAIDIFYLINYLFAGGPAPL